MARGWHYTKHSLSSALLPSFSDMCLVLLFLSFCRFCFVFMLSLELCRCFSDLSCPADYGPEPRISLSVVEAQSVNV